MRDGVLIALDLHLPEGLSAKDKIPTILDQTRYWRGAILRFPFKILGDLILPKDYERTFTRNGFAFVFMDVRGSGASTGMRKSPWSEDEIKDSYEIMDWIIKQPWSDGKIIAFGNSYSATTAELAASVNHPSLKGVIARGNEIDPFLDIAFPGGVYDYWFIENWAQFNNSLDHNTSKGLGFLERLVMKSVKPVQSDKDLLILESAIKEHEGNPNVHEKAINITFRDDAWNDNGDTMKIFSVYHFKEEIERSQSPIYYWGSWMDAATSNVVLSTYLTFSNPQISVIGAWTHGEGLHASPYQPKKSEPNPKQELRLQSWINFMEKCMEGTKFSDKILFYYTMGEERWKSTKKWPVKGIKKEKWYISDNNILTNKKSEINAGVDKYNVNFNTSTGTRNRWHTQLFSYVYYPDRDKEDKKLLTYTSTPLDKDIEITGHPIIDLYMSSTHKDGAIFVYLEDIDSSGKVIYITEGQFRLLHRKISSETPPYKILIPYHSFLKKDSMTMVPDEITQVKFGLLPTSVLIKKGHRIRIAIAGADKDTFMRIPSRGSPSYTIARTAKYPSSIELPIIQRKI